MATMIAVLTVGVLYGVLVAVGLSVLDLLHRLARPHDGVLGYVPGIAGMHDVDDYPDARPIPGLLVYRYDAPLCFANAENFRRRALAALDAEPEPPRWFLLNAEANVEIDSTAAQTLEELHAELRRPRDRTGARPRQAGPAREPAGRRAARPHRRGPDLHDAADGRGGVPGAGPVVPGVSGLLP